MAKQLNKTLGKKTDKNVTLLTDKYPSYRPFVKIKTCHKTQNGKIK